MGMNHHDPELLKGKDKELNPLVMDKIEYQRLKVKDRHVTEDFIQNFILEKADIILIVVGQLTFSDQRLINRIVSNYGNSNKEILVVHNYFELDVTSNVLERVEMDILRSFDIKISTIELSQYLTGKYHQEIYINRSHKKLQVRHLVMAKDETEAGNYFNPSALDFLHALIHSKTPSQPFDVVSLIKDYTQKNLIKYIDIKREKYEVFVENLQGKTRIKCKFDGMFKIKPISFDVTGALQRVNQERDDSTEYDFILTEDELIFRVDLPGIAKNSTSSKKKINYRFERNEKICFVFETDRYDDDPWYKSTKHLVIAEKHREGKIKIEPPCLDNTYKINDKDPKIDIENGILTMRFGFEMINNGTSYSIEL